jgi:phage tail-like protein
MAAHDANDATWYVLRYSEDFVARAGEASGPTAPFGVPSAPWLDPKLLYDEARGVLELQPQSGALPALPVPGIAVDVDGTLYRVDDHGTLVVVRCDGSRAPLVCERGILAQPAGLALDRRGLLYIADPAARRVVVMQPEGAFVETALVGGPPVGLLQEPVDVAVAPSGRIYVADRASGRIVVFSSSMKLLGAIDTRWSATIAPRPIAVMVDADGHLLVADESFPRLLAFGVDGTRLADRDLGTLVAPLAGGEIAQGALSHAYGGRMPRFFVGACGPCASAADDGPARLAEVATALRLLALVLERRFETSGVFVSRALDGGRPGVSWHRVEVDLAADVDDARVLVETFASDDPEPAPASVTWLAPRTKSGSLIGFTRAVPEQLVQSPHGRYLWLRVTLQSDTGHATPTVRAIRAWYPRISWLDLLPSAYRRDPDSAFFLEHFLALFEHVFTGVEDRFVEFSHELDVDAAPRDVIDWLACLVDLCFDPSWSLERRRALVAEAIPLYEKRGTVAGLVRYVEIYTGQAPVLVEGWLERPQRPAVLGRPGAVLGCGLPLLGGVVSAAVLPDAQLWARYAHRFTVFFYVDDRCDTTLVARAVDAIVEVNKPAHTQHRCEAVLPDATVGVRSRVGLDLVLGAAEAPATRLADAGPSGSLAHDGATGGVLGIDTILGSERAAYVHRLDSLLQE